MILPKPPNKDIKVAGIITLILFGLVGIAIFFMFGGFKQFAKNRAQAEAKPLITFMEESGGQKLCDNGDRGLDPFNGNGGSSHAYSAFYIVNDSPTLTRDLIEVSNKMGYRLEADTDYISDIRYDIAHSKSIPPSNRAGIQLNTASSYLKSDNSYSKFLYLYIYRDTAVRGCQNVLQKREAGKAYVSIMIHGL
ncbi:MAG TPA: hypothetical protein VJC09_01185 [Candidatus Saccharimonadales bacterium]|nr:hypothetical protein [Candidatus Saccharimonadales bacterium]